MTEQRLMEWRGNGKRKLNNGLAFHFYSIFFNFSLVLPLANFGALHNVQQQLMEPITLECTFSTIVCNNFYKQVI